MLRNLGIRWQILSALALPVLVLGLISSQVTYQALVDMREARQSRVLAEAAGGFAELVGGLQAERALSVAVRDHQPGADKKLKVVRAAVDEGLGSIRARVYGDSTTPAVQEILDRSAVGHESLPALRMVVDAERISQRTIIERYSDVIVADIEVPSDLAGALRSQAVAANFQRFAQLSRAGEALAQEQLIGATAILNGLADTVDQRELGAQEAAGELALEAFRRTAKIDQQTALETALAAPAARSTDLGTARANFRFAGTTERPEVKLADWMAITSSQLVALRTALGSVNEDGIALASADYKSAKNQLQFTLGAAITITLLTLFLALGLSRRISAPMRRLTLAATQIRDELPRIVATAQSEEDYDLHLPVVEVVGTNEVSQLAAAFVDVNAVVVDIAKEQARLRAAVADMFVNVARRNQVLLSRQLSLIDQLERNEVNPDALEELFRLDHLATRMRRNAESLLVLAGIESGRRLREPMPLSDVVRTATSEIEHYSRVDLSFDVDPPVFAHLALPIAHLVAELLENATNFSDPGSSVMVMATATDNGVRMTVADDGLGIPAAELIEINARIDEPPTAEALSSQRLGFFVVGRLAERLDAKVTLTSGRSRGTAALIDLPNSIFVPGSLDGWPNDRGGAQDAPAVSSRPTVPDQGGAPAWTPEPAGALSGGAPFAPSFPSASAPGAAAEAPTWHPPAPASLPTVPAAFNSAAFDAVNALEPVWTPQPDDASSGGQAVPVAAQPAGPGLPARRGAVPAQAAPVAVPQLLPLPAAGPAPGAMPVAAAPLTATSGQTGPEWADSDWAVSAWAAPAAEEPAAPIEAAAPPVAGQSGASIFSGFRGRKAATQPEAVAPAAPSPAEPVTPPIAFLDSATAVGEWFNADSGSTPEPDQRQAWDDVSTPVESDPTATAWNDQEADGYLSPQAAFAVDDEPVPADPAPTPSTPEPVVAEPMAWTPQPTASPSGPEASTPESSGYSAEPENYPSVPEVWAPESAAETWAAEPGGYEPAPEPTPEPVAEASAAEPAIVAQTPEPVVEAWAEPAAEAWAEPAAEAWAEPAAEAWAPEPAVEAWAPEPAAEALTLLPAAEAWAPEPTPEVWTPEPTVEAWTPEPAAEAWAPEPTPEVWTPEPTVEAWAPEPATEAFTLLPAAEARTPTPAPAPEAWTPEPAVEAWTPEPAVETWTPEPASSQAAPEPWTPEPAAGDWAPAPEAWAPAHQSVPTQPPAPEPLMQTLTAAIDILPQRASIRTALRRGRRKGDPQPSDARPFNGGFDPIAPAREFARREGFGPTVEPQSVPTARPAEVASVPAPAGPAVGLVPEPSRPADSSGAPVERRQHPRPGDQPAQPGRSALASEALTELSRLSSYSPTSMPVPDKGGLQRRTPSEVPSEVPIADGDSGADSGQRARTAASVRSMLAGFKAGVERGRTSPAANRPVGTLPPPPRSSSPEEPR